jgi:pullulanase
MQFLFAQFLSEARIEAVCSEPPAAIKLNDIILAPAAELLSVHSEGACLLIDVSGVHPWKRYSLLIRGLGMIDVDPDPWLNSFSPQGPLGCVEENGRQVFRLFAPRASSVRLILYDSVLDVSGDSWPMTRRNDGVWEAVTPADQSEKLYAFSVDGPRASGESFNPRVHVADPYARAVVSRNTYRHEARAVVPSALPDYDWQGDRHVSIRVEDLVIYEMHVKDMTAHPSSGIPSDLAGSYAGLLDDNGRGGLSHLLSLGINAIELLPCQHFAWMEPPYLRHVPGDIYNSWNPWERNHWGYMTSYFFSPEPRYSVDAKCNEGGWNDVNGRHLTEFRDMVRRFHQHGIAVILDVVFNHTSQYDYQPLKYIDKRYYYHLHENGDFRGDSGCGNDVRTTRPAVRKMIVDCIRYWIEEYHIDGFRFDLAAMIDDETLLAVRDEARALFPDVILIAEPWGGNRYDPAGFSRLGYSSWNDIFRNGVKGWDPMQGRGYMFGNWNGNTPDAFGKWMLASTVVKGGPFLSHEHSVNYLESHDGYTLADFIRIATGGARPGQQIKESHEYQCLRGRALELSKLAAFILLTSRGAVMLHAGQEFGRGKIIADREIPDVTPRIVDHNSYEKDDETNWLDYTVADMNSELLSYYRGMIALRNALPELRASEERRYRFLQPSVEIAGGFILHDAADSPILAVLINANQEHVARYDLGMVGWKVMADAEAASLQGLREMKGKEALLPPCSAMLLQKTT